MRGQEVVLGQVVEQGGAHSSASTLQLQAPLCQQGHLWRHQVLAGTHTSASASCSELARCSEVI
jgi:hypothetical protein